MEKSSSKVITGRQSKEAKAWLPPDMNRPSGKVAGYKKPGSMLTAAQLEELQKEAYQEGFERGKKAGFEYGHKEALATGQKQLQEWRGRIDELLSSLNTPFENLDDQVEQQLVDMIISMVRQLVRREVKMDPSQIIGVVREALSILPVSSRGVRVVLHPDDATLVREIFDMTDKELGWSVTEDPVLARGGCRVLTESSQVDATLESRLAALIAPMLGGERDEDNPVPDEVD